MIDHHRALIYTMVLVSASDAEMTDSELSSIGQQIKYLPVFRDFEVERLPLIAAECTELLDDPEGLEKALEMIGQTLPAELRETAYAVACDIAAADGRVTQEELRLLEMIRHQLGIGRLVGAAIERGAKARHQILQTRD